MYYDLKNDIYFEKKDLKSLRFLYNTFLGRLLLKILTTKTIANIYAKYMNSTLSKHKINSFIKKNNINMDDYQKQDYKTFNEFFTRNIKYNKRKTSNGLIAVCDSKLSVYEINDESILNIKGSTYSIEELIQEKDDYKYALIFRLAVDDYHHYVFPDDGELIREKTIKGKLHVVQPIAQKRYKIFHENQRNVTFLNCKNLGKVCYIEVGALLIGKINNKDKKKFEKGEEKGYFEFGGSTVILLIQKDLNIKKKIIENSKKGIETIVKLGEKIDL